ncbi:hypothetical protein FOCC_FOCC014191 [Frankliniella occidentalis]|nr:hypothetical protein FOCC_FOCC014191 [Frankliniella occidentalis]
MFFNIPISSSSPLLYIREILWIKLFISTLRTHDKENIGTKPKRKSGFDYYFGNWGPGSKPLVQSATLNQNVVSEDSTQHNKSQDVSRNKRFSTSPSFQTSVSKKTNDSPQILKNVTLNKTFSPEVFSTPMVSPAASQSHNSKPTSKAKLFIEGTVAEDPFVDPDEPANLAEPLQSDGEDNGNRSSNIGKQINLRRRLTKPQKTQPSETDSSESDSDFSPSEEEYLPEKTIRDKNLGQRCKSKSQRLNRAKTAVAKKKNVQVVQASTSGQPSDSSSNNSSGDESETESESESEAEQPKTATRKRKPKKQSDIPEPDYVWCDDDITETVLGVIPHSASSLKEPIEYFNMFFSDNILQTMVEETNMYSQQRGGDDLHLTIEELRRFLGLWIFMGICTLPCYEDYWSGITRVRFVAEAMPISRFKLIRARLHLIDNSTIPKDNKDPLIRVRPLLQHIKQKCNNLPQHTATFSIDESMSPYKGTKAGPLRQYIKGKPHKWGFKAFMLTSSSGLVYDFIVYSGGQTFELEGVVEQEGLGVGGNVLKEKLGLLSIGTIRSNRTKGCPLPSDKLVMKQGRGTSLVQSTCNGQVAVLKWVDNKVVNMAGSWAGRSPQHIVKRWDKKAKKKIDVACPQIVRLYNKNMGGVDLFDMLMHLYKLPSRAKRWPVPLISFMIDLSLVNAFLLYRADQKVDNDVVESSKAFRLRVVEALVSSKPKKKVGRPTLEESSRTEEVPRNHTKKLPPDVLSLDCSNCIENIYLSTKYSLMYEIREGLIVTKFIVPNSNFNKFVEISIRIKLCA